MFPHPSLHFGCGRERHHGFTSFRYTTLRSLRQKYEQSRQSFISRQIDDGWEERERKKESESEWRRGSDTYLKPGAMLAQLPVRSQMQYGSREARQALQREEEEKRYNVTVSQSAWKYPSIHPSIIMSSPALFGKCGFFQKTKCLHAGSDDCLLYNTAAVGKRQKEGERHNKGKRWRERRDEKEKKCYDEKEKRWNRRDRIKGKESRRAERKRKRDEKYGEPVERKTREKEGRDEERDKVKSQVIWVSSDSRQVVTHDSSLWWRPLRESESSEKSFKLSHCRRDNVVSSVFREKYQVWSYLRRVLMSWLQKMRCVKSFRSWNVDCPRDIWLFSFQEELDNIWPLPWSRMK